MTKKISFKNALCVIALILCGVLFLGCESTPKVTESEGYSIDKVQRLIREGKKDEAKEIFSARADINEADADGNTVLHTVARINDSDLASYFIHKGANPDLKNNDGDTPVHIAIKNASFECGKYLLSVNPNIFARDADGKTVLSLALELGSDFYPAVLNDETGNVRDENNKSVVHYIVEAENESALEYCVNKNLPLSYSDNAGKTPLALAYEKNSAVGIKMASMLLQAGAVPIRENFSYFEDCIKTRNVSLRFDDGQTPLHFAAIFGHTAIAEYLIKNGAAINTKDILGATPLHEAVRYGNKDIVNILLENGAEVNSQDSLGKTPLLLFVPKGCRMEIYSSLLSGGANPNAKDMYGDTPLHLATMTRMERRVLESLKNAGADINERNKKGVTPMALAVENNNIDHINFYATNDADIHAEDNMGNTPISRVLENRSAASLDYLKIIVNENNILSRDSYGNTPLHIAINKNSSVDKVKYLISLAPDIDVRNRNGDTPLFLAVQKNRKAQGELLIKSGADVFCTNNENYSPLRKALENGAETQEWILTSDVINKKDGTGNTPLHYASEWKLDDAVDVLLAKGASPNVKNSNGETPLFKAIKPDSASTIDLLLRKGAKRNERDNLGNTAFHYCVRYDAKNSAMKLLQWKVDVNMKNLAGKTALATCARSGRIPMANLLLENGANVNETDATGKTCLFDAIQSNNIEMASLLLRHGASAQIQEIYGRNAYHEAALTGNIALITLVQQAGGNPLSRDSQGLTPFSLVLNKSPEIMQSVLGPNRLLMDSDSNTPLHIAIQNEAKSDVIKYLILQGYPIDARNSEGLTALCLAVEKGQNDAVRVLLQNEADPFITTGNTESPIDMAFKKGNKVLDNFIEIVDNKTDYQGNGILHYAAKTADIKTVNHLVEKGLDVTIRNIDGETPRDVARRWGRAEIEEILSAR